MNFWIRVSDKEREYIINMSNVIAFAKMSACNGSPYIDLAINTGSIQLIYNSEEERDLVYENMVLKINTSEIYE